MEIIAKNFYRLWDIQSAIDEANYGDTVTIPAGKWNSAPIALKSGITLNILKGAEVYFNSDKSLYDTPTFVRWEGVECFNYRPLIYAYCADDVSIIGGGTLYGNGVCWWEWKKLQAAAADRLCGAQANGIPVKERVLNLSNSFLRPSMINLIGCENVTVKDITIVDSPMWSLHPVYCRNVTVKGVRIYSDGPNTDGCNPDSCENVTIDGCFFSTGDDCIAINSGLNEDGIAVGKPCKDVIIKNCTFKKGHAAVAIGSGMSGGVKNIVVSGCDISGVERGIRIKSMKGRGGYVKDIVAKRLRMRDVLRCGIEVTMNYPSSTSKPLSDRLPIFKNFTFEDIYMDGAPVGISCEGLEESPIEGLSIGKIDYNNVPRHTAFKSCNKN